jgi:hypothetical protein
MKKHPERPDITSVVVANNDTGAIWGGVWGNPESVDNTNMLRDVRKHTGEDYAIMSFLQAENIRLASRQKANLESK